MVKKVLLVIPTYLPIIGGAELAVHNIAKKLKENGVTADVLTLNITKKRWKTSLKTEIQYIEGIKVYRIGTLNLLFFLQNTRFKSYLMRYLGVQMIPGVRLFKILPQYDIIHFNDEVNLSLPFFVSLFGIKKTIFHLRTFEQLYPSFLKSPLSRYVLSKVSNHFIIETKSYLPLLEKLGITHKTFHFWNKGVDINQFKPNDEKKNNDSFNILTVGRFNEKNKGFHVISEALSSIKTSVNLTIITTSYEENDYALSLQKKIELLNRFPNITIQVERNVDHNKIVEYYQRADAFVFVPLKDSMPNVLLEASSCALPIISTKVGGIPKIIMDGKTGYLIEPGNVKQLIYRLEYLMKNKAYRTEIGNNARTYVMKNFSYSKSIEKLLSIYNQISNS